MAVCQERVQRQQGSGTDDFRSERWHEHRQACGPADGAVRDQEPEHPSGHEFTGESGAADDLDGENSRAAGTSYDAAERSGPLPGASNEISDGIAAMRGHYEGRNSSGTIGERKERITGSRAGVVSSLAGLGNLPNLSCTPVPEFRMPPLRGWIRRRSGFAWVPS